MASHRTTVSLEPRVYDAARAGFKQLGFARLGDLINAALAEYLYRHQIQQKLQQMEAIADDPQYVALVREVSAEAAGLDRDGLGGDY